MTGVLPLALATLLNFWIAAGWFVKKDPIMAVVFICYGVATACFLYKMVQT